MDSSECLSDRPWLCVSLEQPGERNVSNGDPVTKDLVDQRLRPRDMAPESELSPVDNPEVVSRPAENVGAQLLNLSCPPAFERVRTDLGSDEEKVDIALDLTIATCRRAE